MTARGEVWPTGVPCWADINVPSIPEACDFYEALLGWSFRVMPGDFNGYRIADVDGADAAGIGQLLHGGTPVWTLYFASDDATATADAIEVNGGTLLLPPVGVGTLGRVCIALDPTGATFGVWEPLSHTGAAVKNAPGALAWCDLRSPDPDAARTFYSRVFGFQNSVVAGAPARYQSFSVRGQSGPLGGIGGMFGSPAVPAHWLLYFEVAGAEQACALTEKLGGTVAMPVFPTPYGRMAGLTDPQGASFWVVESNRDSRTDSTGG